MSPQDRMEYRRQKALDKRAKKEKERKRRMG